jgi:hypothetical protein
MEFQWTFEPIGQSGALLSQRIVLRGERAEDYLVYAKTLEGNLPLAMKKMASAIEDALARSPNPRQ